MVVSDFSSDLDLFCHVIQSQAALACAFCARSLGSGNRCPGVLWSGVLALLLSSFSSLPSMARKLINFQSCTILLVAFLGKCQVFGLKISFKKANGSSSYSSITISSRVLLLIFTPQPLRAVGVLFSPMVSGWAGGQREIVCPGCISETVRCRKLILGRDIG